MLPPSPVRAMVIFSGLLFLLNSVGVALQQTLALPGMVLIQIALFLSLSVAAARFIDRQRFRDLFRLRWLNLSGISKVVLLGILVWSLAHVVTSLTLLAVEQLGGTLYQPYQDLMAGAFWVALLVGALVPAIAEEFAFRGYIQWNLSPLGSRTTVIVTGLLFGIMHLSLIRLIPLTLIGIFLAIAVQRTGSLMAGVLMHFVNNATVIILAFSLRQVTWPEGWQRSSSVEATWLGAMLLAIMAVALFAAARAVALSLGPKDTVGSNQPMPSPAEPPEPAGSTQAVPDGPLQAETVGSGSRWLLLVPLLPAFGLYALAVANEIYVVFFQQ